MPIRINLLAEAQAAEELRRRDPVKRALWAAGFLVSLVAIWCLTLQFKVFSAKSELNGLESKWKALEKNYQVAVESQRRYLEAEEKLSALARLTTNRFIWGNTLNALQQTLGGVDDVHFIRFRSEQVYTAMEEIKARTNSNSTVTPARPASASEKIVLTIDAVDSSAQPGSQVNKLKEAIAAVPYFQAHLQKTNGVLLTSLSAPQVSPTGRSSFVMFTMQCFFPEKVR
jgi:hypothetical protein